MLENISLDFLKNKNILASVSGGVDSMVMLDILIKNMKKYEYNIEVFHFNHKTRDGQSDLDQKFVEEFCKSNNLLCHISSYSMIKYSQENNVSEEEAGRILRKDAINSIIKNNNKDYIITTAHNMDDQVETVLMRILRGTGIDGLKAMSKVDDNIYRPLLEYSKDQIIKYQKENSISFVQDSSNFENEYTRNSIRNEIIPFIQENYNPNLYNSIIRLSEISADYIEYIKKSIDLLFNKLVIYNDEDVVIFIKSDIQELTDFEKIQLVRKCINLINDDTYRFAKNHFNEILKIINSRNSVDFTYQNIIFYNSFDKFVIRKSFSNIDHSSKRITSSDILEYNGYTIMVHDILANNSNNDIIVRTRNKGDRIIINNKLVKLKDFFINNKIDRYIRDIIPVISINDNIVAIGDIYSENKFISVKEKKWKVEEIILHHLLYL